MFPIIRILNLAFGEETTYPQEQDMLVVEELEKLDLFKKVYPCRGSQKGQRVKKLYSPLCALLEAQAVVPLKTRRDADTNVQSSVSFLTQCKLLRAFGNSITNAAGGSCGTNLTEMYRDCLIELDKDLRDEVEGISQNTTLEDYFSDAKAPRATRGRKGDSIIQHRISKLVGNIVAEFFRGNYASFKVETKEGKIVQGNEKQMQAFVSYITDKCNSSEGSSDLFNSSSNNQGMGGDKLRIMAMTEVLRGVAHSADVSSKNMINLINITNNHAQFVPLIVAGAPHTLVDSPRRV